MGPSCNLFKTQTAVKSQIGCPRGTDHMNAGDCAGSIRLTAGRKKGRHQGAALPLTLVIFPAVDMKMGRIGIKQVFKNPVNRQGLKKIRRRQTVETSHEITGHFTALKGQKNAVTCLLAVITGPVFKKFAARGRIGKILTGRGGKKNVLNLRPETLDKRPARVNPWARRVATTDKVAQSNN